MGITNSIERKKRVANQVACGISSFLGVECSESVIFDCITTHKFESAKRVLSKHFGLDIYEVIRKAAESETSKYSCLPYAYNNLVVDVEDVLNKRETLSEEELFELLDIKLVDNQLTGPPHNLKLTASAALNHCIDVYVQEVVGGRSHETDLDLIRLSCFKKYCKTKINWANLFVRCITYDKVTDKFFVNEYAKLIFTEVNKHVSDAFIRKMLKTAHIKPNTTLEVR